MQRGRGSGSLVPRPSPAMYMRGDQCQNCDVIVVGVVVQLEGATKRGYTFQKEGVISKKRGYTFQDEGVYFSGRGGIFLKRGVVFGKKGYI